MKLPRLFREIHGDQIFRSWIGAGRPPIVNVVPREPLGGVNLDGPVAGLDSVVTIVSVRCRNDRGTLAYEAASPVDLKVAEEWAARHSETPHKDFSWFPSLGA